MFFRMTHSVEGVSLSSMLILLNVPIPTSEFGMPFRYGEKERLKRVQQAAFDVRENAI